MSDHPRDANDVPTTSELQGLVDEILEATGLHYTLEERYDFCRKFQKKVWDVNSGVALVRRSFVDERNRLRQEVADKTSLLRQLAGMLKNYGTVEYVNRGETWETDWQDV